MSETRVSVSNIRLFALHAATLGESVARRLGLTTAPHELRCFEDGEHKIRPLESVRGCDVFVLASLNGSAEASVNDRLCQLLFFIGALKDAAADRVTALVPYLCYARKDRKTKSRDPVTTRYLASLFEAVGVDRVVTLDVHNLAAFQNAFRCPTEHLEAAPFFVEHLVSLAGDRPLAIVAPDEGGVKRAEHLRRTLATLVAEPSFVFLEKRRSGGMVTGDAIVGEVSGRAAVIVDDMISTGTTLRRTAAACRRQGAASVRAVASHGVFLAGSEQLFDSPDLDQVIVTNSIDQERLAGVRQAGRLAVIDVAPLLAEAIARLHTGGSMVELGEVLPSHWTAR